MTEQIVFSIRNLECAYTQEAPVLRLDHLDIPAGKVVFIIGRSGVGKSTFLETLSLMNKTIVHRENTSIMLKTEDEQETELKDCWVWTNERLCLFRRKHFSFIFQQTNLMPNFTAGENMAIRLLFKGHSFAEAKQEVLAVMKRLFLDPGIFDKRVTEISGGQRQRLAFVRAITSEFTVLFGDEPTGNLDEYTAEGLVKVLWELAAEKGKSVILASHNLSMAEKFADMVIPITQTRNELGLSVGYISNRNILRREKSGWSNGMGEPVFSPLAFMNDCIAVNEVSE